TATKLYVSGETVPGGARLHAVYSDHVLLERNGTLESLFLPRQQTLATSSAAIGLVGRHADPSGGPEVSAGVEDDFRATALERARRMDTFTHPNAAEAVRTLVKSAAAKCLALRSFRRTVLRRSKTWGCSRAIWSWRSMARGSTALGNLTRL